MPNRSLSQVLFLPLKALRRIIWGLGLQNSAFLRQGYGRLKASLKSREAEIDGHRLLLDPGDSLDLSLSSDYEAFERRLVSELLQPGQTVVDIGANLGVFSLLFAKSVGPEGKVYAFEPSPANFELLKRNLARNGYPGVQAIPKAVSDRNGRLQLFLNPNNAGDHRIYSSGEVRESVEIETVALDDFFPFPYSTLDLIKMDIQGAELTAFRGMDLILSTQPEIVVVFEFWPAGIAASGCDPREVLGFLRDRGFLLYELEDCEQRLREVADVQDLLERFPAERIEHTNLLAVRNKKSLDRISRYLECAR